MSKLNRCFRKYNSLFCRDGQIALIILLIMVVVLTVGLSVVSRSITDVLLSETKESGVRVFNAAEAGIEQALAQEALTASYTSHLELDGVTANVGVAELRTIETLVKRNDVLEVSLAGATAQSVQVSWTKESDAEQNPATCTEGEGGAPASVEIIRLREEGGNAVFRRYLYNTGRVGCVLTNGFEVAPVIAPSGFVSSVIFNDIDGDSSDGVYDIALRIRTFYNRATMAVVPTDSGELPIQQYLVSSTATASTGETRTVELTRSVNALPAIFDYAIFSGSTITK